MPNWCENKVMISAKKEEDMKFFKDKAFKKDKDGAEVFQFNNLIPRPEEEEDWYNWNRNNWGTKWDVEAMTDTEGVTWMELEFDTAWGPPEQIYLHMFNRFPNLSISWFYHEPGMQLAGYLND